MNPCSFSRENKVHLEDVLYCEVNSKQDNLNLPSCSAYGRFECSAQRTLFSEYIFDAG
jgi:hypothetical protein